MLTLAKFQPTQQLIESSISKGEKRKALCHKQTSFFPDIEPLLNNISNNKQRKKVRVGCERKRKYVSPKLNLRGEKKAEIETICIVHKLKIKNKKK